MSAMRARGAMAKNILILRQWQNKECQNPKEFLKLLRKKLLQVVPEPQCSMVGSKLVMYIQHVSKKELLPYHFKVQEYPGWFEDTERFLKETIEPIEVNYVVEKTNAEMVIELLGLICNTLKHCGEHRTRMAQILMLEEKDKSTYAKLAMWELVNNVMHSGKAAAQLTTILKVKE